MQDMVDMLNKIETDVRLAKELAEHDERYKHTGLPIRLKLWLWDVEELRKRVSEVEE